MMVHLAFTTLVLVLLSACTGNKGPLGNGESYGRTTLESIPDLSGSTAPASSNLHSVLSPFGFAGTLLKDWSTLAWKSPLSGPMCRTGNYTRSVYQTLMAFDRVKCYLTAAERFGFLSESMFDGTDRTFVASNIFSENIALENLKFSARYNIVAQNGVVQSIRFHAHEHMSGPGDWQEFKTYLDGQRVDSRIDFKTSLKTTYRMNKATDYHYTDGSHRTHISGETDNNGTWLSKEGSHVTTLSVRKSAPLKPWDVRFNGTLKEFQKEFLLGIQSTDLVWNFVGQPFQEKFLTEFDWYNGGSAQDALVGSGALIGEFPSAGILSKKNYAWDGESRQSVPFESNAHNGDLQTFEYPLLGKSALDPEIPASEAYIPVQSADEVFAGEAGEAFLQAVEQCRMNYSFSITQDTTSWADCSTAGY